MTTTPTRSSPRRAPVLGLLAAAGLLAFGGAALAQQAPAQAPQHVPLQKSIGVPSYANRPIPSLAVINAAGAKLDADKLTLTGVAPNTIVFADRPVRAAGHQTLKQFLEQWDGDKNSFAADPPNATVSVLGANPGEVSDTVVVLKTPKLDGSTLTFDVSVLEGALLPGGPVAVFIDAFAMRGPDGGGFAHAGGFGGGGYYHPPAYHGAWYGHPGNVNVNVNNGYGGWGAGAAGAAIGFTAGAIAGSAAARPPAPAYAYPPYCGYYPYPACY